MPQFPAPSIRSCQAAGSRDVPPAPAPRPPAALPKAMFSAASCPQRRPSISHPQPSICSVFWGPRVAFYLGEEKKPLLLTEFVNHPDPSPWPVSPAAHTCTHLRRPGPVKLRLCFPPWSQADLSTARPSPALAHGSRADAVTTLGPFLWEAQCVTETMLASGMQRDPAVHSRTGVTTVPIEVCNIPVQEGPLTPCLAGTHPL